MYSKTLASLTSTPSSHRPSRNTHLPSLQRGEHDNILVHYITSLFSFSTATYCNPWYFLLRFSIRYDHAEPRHHLSALVSVLFYQLKLALTVVVSYRDTEPDRYDSPPPAYIDSEHEARPCKCSRRGRNLVVCIDGTLNEFGPKVLMIP